MGGGGGIFGGKGGGQTASGTPQSAELAAEASTEIRETRPARRVVTGQTIEALQTGAAPDVQIPVIQRAMEAIRASASRARLQTTEQLARTRLDKTPYGQRILSEQDINAAIAEAGVPVQGTREVIDRGLPVTTGALQIGFGGLSNATQTAGQIQSSKISADAQVLAALFQSLGMAAQGAGRSSVGAG